LFQFFWQMGNRTVVWTISWPSIMENLSIVLIKFCHMKNLTVISTIFWPYIISNLSLFSILLSNGKSNCCFNTFFALHCRQSIRRFHSLLKWENQIVVSTIVWPCIVSSLSIVWILLSNGKSNLCFNNFLTLHCKQSIHWFNSFVKWKF